MAILCPTVCPAVVHAQEEKPPEKAKADEAAKGDEKPRADEKPTPDKPADGEKPKEGEKPKGEEAAKGDEKPASEEKPDKSHYDLFHRTPDNLKRDLLRTDRPERTDTPITLDAGHVQVELDFVNWTYDRIHAPGGERIREETFVVANNANVKIGLTNTIDMEVICPLYIHDSIHDWTTTRQRHLDGMGDVTFRFKCNFYGNDSETGFAFALMPVIELPTTVRQLGAGTVVAGCEFPMAFELPYGFDLGFNVNFFAQQDDPTERWFMTFVDSVCLGKEIYDRLRVFVELWSSCDTAKSSPNVMTFDCGVSYKINNDVQIDGAVCTGLTRNSPDVNTFMGISVRY
jgi:hypothetical protein